jgi:hypothetical protein
MLDLTPRCQNSSHYDPRKPVPASFKGELPVARGTRATVDFTMQG